VTSRRHIAAALAVLCLGGCTEHDEDPAIEAVLGDARRAVLAGDGPRACRLLTPHGRRRALAFGAELEPAPASCEEVVRTRRALARRDPASSWPEDLSDATFEVLSMSNGRAQVEMRVHDLFGVAIRWRIQLHKTGAGWRIDDSNAVPATE
jgi:hypothetical protein